MKKFIIISIMFALFASATSLRAQNRQEDYLGLPGDNLNLYAVMRLFQESKTLEEFERNLNDQQSTINNLDLNNDNLVDYIKVMDDVDGDVHNIVLQVAVSPRENQDVAVFTVQRFNNGQVFIQLTGDEELYGRDYIIEPIIDETPNPGYAGQYERTSPTLIANWPVVRFIYLPSYRVWHSSWNWGYYPSYWHPWSPFSYHYYYGYHYNWNNVYFGSYRHWDTHRYTRWNDFYYRGRRSYSPEVSHRIQTGTYKTTYSHPDQRRAGEARFAEKHPDQYRRSDNPSRINSSDSRRSNSNVTNRNGVNSSPNNNNRRTSTDVNRSANPPSDRNNSVNRRPGNTSTDRSVTTTTTNRTVTNPSSNRSVTNPSSNRSVTNPSSNRSVTNSSTTRTVTNSSTNRSKEGNNGNNGANRSVTNQSSRQSGSSASPKTQTKSSGASSTRRTKTESTDKANKKSDSDNNSSDRRK